MKLLIVSDNHENFLVLDHVIASNKGVDWVIHCGDFCGSKDDFEYIMNKNGITNYLIVRGNNDYDSSMLNEVILKLNDLNILVVHGHRHRVSFDRMFLKDYALDVGCELVFYGHNHIYRDELIEGIRLLSPGSITFNRDYTRQSYMLVDIKNKDDILIERINL